MSEAKHTPGPWNWDGNVWQYDEKEEAPWLWGNGEKQRVLSGDIHCNTKADARLIAAAPDLLKALERIVKADDAKELTQTDIEQGRAAIARATGKGE